MKAIKRTVAALLATLMLATSTSFTLAAETYTDDEAVVVGKVNAAGIMTGTDKGFEPSKSLTRAEAAAIIVRMKGISESAVKASAGTTLFNDVAASHWASGYVNQASNLGIVKGVSATEFAPDREVTVAEFTTMAVRALGAGQLVDSEGTWPINYVNFANENGILDDVNAIYTSVATRLQAATIVVNTLEANMWTKGEYDTTGKITFKKGDETILGSVLKLVESNVKIDGINTKDGVVLYNTDKEYEVADGVDLSALRVGLTYNFYASYKKSGQSYVIDEIKGFWIDDNDTIKFTAIKSFDNNSTAADETDDSIKLTVDGKDKEYKVLDSDVLVYINEVESTTKISGLSKNANVFGTAYLDDNGKVTSIYLTDYEYYSVVDEVTSTKVKFDTSVKGASNKATLVTNVDDNEYALTKDGKAISYSDLEEGDAIAWYDITINTSDVRYVGEVLEVVEGKVSAVKNNTDYQTITLNKTKYDVVKTLFTGNKLTAGKEIKAYLNHAGEIAMFDYVDDKASSDVAIVTYFKPYEDKYGWDNADVKLTYMDGTTSEVLSIDVAASIEELFDVENAKESSTVKKYKYDEMTAGDEITLADALKEITNTTSTNILGYAVCYSVSGSEVTFNKPSTGDDLEFNSVAEDEELTIGKKVNTVSAATGITKTIYVTEDTTLIKTKADGTYGLKTEIVSLDDLEKTSVFKGNSYVVEYDEDNEEVKAVVFGLSSELARTTETNFAFIEEVRDAEKVDKKAAVEVDVIYVDGHRDTLMMVDGTTSSYSTAKGYEGKFVDIAVNKDSVITKASLLPASEDPEDALDEKYTGEAFQMTKFVESKDEMTINSAVYTLADEILVLEYDSDDDAYTVKSVSDINEYDSDAKENTLVDTLVTYTDEDGEEVVFIVYQIVK